MARTNDDTRAKSPVRAAARTSVLLLAIASAAHPGRASDLTVEPVSTGAEPARVSAPSTRALEVEVITRSERGLVFCALWPSAEGYPVDRTRAAHEGMSERPATSRALIRFASVAHGEYALACFHDENENHTLDTNFLGIPSEGTGASNGARGFMGPPRFEAARFLLTPRGPDSLSIRIDY